MAPTPIRSQEARVGHAATHPPREECRRQKRRCFHGEARCQQSSLIPARESTRAREDEPTAGRLTGRIASRSEETREPAPAKRSLRALAEIRERTPAQTSPARRRRANGETRPLPGVRWRAGGSLPSRGGSIRTAPCPAPEGGRRSRPSGRRVWPR